MFLQKKKKNASSSLNAEYCYDVFIHYIGKKWTISITFPVTVTITSHGGFQLVIGSTEGSQEIYQTRVSYEIDWLNPTPPPTNSKSRESESAAWPVRKMYQFFSVFKISRQAFQLSPLEMQSVQPVISSD